MDNDPKMASKPQQVIRKRLQPARINKFYEGELPAPAGRSSRTAMSPSSSTWLPPAKELGGKVKFVDAVRFEKGEGIEKKQEDFAAEVAAQMNMGK